MTSKDEDRARRWLEAERQNAEDEAERSFARLVETLPAQTPSADFSDRVARAAARARFRRAVFGAGRRAALVAAGLAGLLVATSFAAETAGPYAARAIVRGVDALFRGAVWLIMLFNEGLDAWAIVVRVARALGSAIASPEVSTALVGIELVGAGALYMLYRLLSQEKRS